MSYTVLIVDDDKEFREEFSESLDDYNVLQSAGGAEALSILKKANDVDVVILDYLMPGMRGTEVLKEIRQFNPSIGVIVLTGHSSKDTAIEFLKNRADDYLEKPCRMEKAREVIARVLAEKGVKGMSDDGSTAGKVERAKDYIRRNWDKPVRLKDVASDVFLSPKYFSRVFKEKAKTDLRKFRTHVKMEKAGELLIKTRLNINEIAHKLGYENTETFVRVFKKKTRVTPSDYRHKKKSKIRH